MEVIKKLDSKRIQRIGIVGAGFTGTALAALLYQSSNTPLEIYLFDKTGEFGAGSAYATPFPFHLLNARARDMSAFEEDATHFVRWLENDSIAKNHLDSTIPIAEQFVPRFLYRRYLQHIINDMQAKTNNQITVKLVSATVIDAHIVNDQVSLKLDNDDILFVNKVILATGNDAPSHFPFPVARDVKCIENPWHYEAVKQVGKHESVLIVGTGLSMIDVMLTLQNQQHEAHVFAVSRHGLLPLPHAEACVGEKVVHENMPTDIRSLTRYVREKSIAHASRGGDWRSIVNALRPQVSQLWQQTNAAEKQRFMRHVMPYWNIHRHRVHDKLYQMLESLQASGQLTILSGRVISVDQAAAIIKPRHKHTTQKIKVDWVINCMGPSLHNKKNQQPLIKSLLKQGLISQDSLQMGLAVSIEGAVKDSSGSASHYFYTLGPAVLGTYWESLAVPEIRQQGLTLAKHLLQNNK